MGGETQSRQWNTTDDPKHRTFNIVSIVCIALTFLSLVWFAAAIVWKNEKKKV